MGEGTLRRCCADNTQKATHTCGDTSGRAALPLPSGAPRALRMAAACLVVGAQAPTNVLAEQISNGLPIRSTFPVP